MADEAAPTFHWVDYLLFTASFVVTIVVGVVVAIRDKWATQTSESYLMANRDMNWFLVGISYFGSMVNAVLFIGATAEFYYFGSQFVWICVGLLLAGVYMCLITVPMLYKLDMNITSVYQYLELRFNLPVRMLASLIYICGNLVMMSVILYAPSLILSQVSGLDIRWCVVIGALVCIIYTGLGGMKAVVWVDNIQVFIMVAGLLIMVIKGTLDAGGIYHVWDVYQRGNRTNIFDTDPSPFKRHTVWNLIFLSGLAFLATSGSHQQYLQRILTIKNKRKAQLAPLVGTLFFPVFILLLFIVAMCAFTELGGNEPLLRGLIKKPGQIFPYYMMYLLRGIPGVPGIVVAATFAGGLSTLSSGLNGMAASILEDWVKPIHLKIHRKNISERAAGITSRVLGLLLGFVLMGVGLSLLRLDDMVYSITRTVESFISGPLFMMFIAGFFIPFLESWGVFAGGVCSLAWGIQMYVGSLKYGNNIGLNQAPLYMDNFTVVVYPPVSGAEPGLYDISYTWYTMLDIAVGLGVAFIISPIVLLCRYMDGKKGASRDLLADKFYMYSWHDFLVAIAVRKPNNEADAVQDSVTLPHLGDHTSVTKL